MLLFFVACVCLFCCGALFCISVMIVFFSVLYLWLLVVACRSSCVCCWLLCNVGYCFVFVVDCSLLLLVVCL